MATTKAKVKTTKKVSPAKASASAATTKKTVFKKENGEPNYPAIIFAEVLGTFVLTLVALASLKDLSYLYMGITLAVLVLGFGAISGAHLNPAVTFGLWSIRKLKTTLLPVYFIAQFVGAILAILLIGLITGTKYPLDFGHFWNISWPLLSIELAGAALLVFGILNAINSDKLGDTGKAFGVGLSLSVALLMSFSLLSYVREADIKNYQAKMSESSSQQSEAESNEIPATLRISGATLNPAIALVSTELTDEQVLGTYSEEKTALYSRLNIGVILGTLAGAALGANLYLALAYINRRN